MTTFIPPRAAEPEAPHEVPAPRLIATDLDGTLLRSDKTVSSRTVAALTAAEDAGIEVFFVTGRPARWMGVVSAYTARHGIAICANGAAVVDLHRDEIIDIHPLAADDAIAAVRALRDELPGVTFAVEDTAGFSFEPGYPLPEAWPMVASRTAPAEELLSTGTAPVLKLLVKHDSIDPDMFLALGRKVAGEHTEVTRSSPSPLLEISALGVSKATTLAQCCAQRGIVPAEVVAFGDMPNDLPMLTWAGASYAVANAHPEVLAATTHLAATNDEDGVASVIEAILARMG